MNKKEAVVLVSGGLDSAVCLAQAVEQFGAENVLALSMSYGQTHDKEVACASAITEYYDVEIMRTDLSEVFKLSACPMLQHNEAEIPQGSYDEQQKEQEGTVSTYVPFRNGLFLSYATAIAYSVGASTIYYGAHADDAAGEAYPDCSEKFKDLMGSAIFTGTGEKVSLEAPLIYMTKSEVVKCGLVLKVPFELTWSCYEGDEEACGTCGTCIDRQKAFHDNDTEDPISYKKG